LNGEAFSGQEGVLSKIDWPLEIVEILLLCIGEEIPVKKRRSWKQKQRNEVAEWASKLHLRASDNLVRVPPKPKFL
jgi:hypothetical protein